MKNITIYTDGACSGNPGPGGWAAILMYNGHEKVIAGGAPQTTNNRMELFAVIEALRHLKEPCEAEIYSDSAYFINAVNEGWLEKWQKNGWRNYTKDEVKNKDLWTDYLLKSKIHRIRVIKVKGHSDNEYNNRCDILARGEINKLTQG